MSIAHFFWHGRPLSLWTRVCLASFVRHGFDVRLHAFDDLDVPAGVQVIDASRVLPLDFAAKTVHAGVRGSLANFSDFFRYRLLAQEDGWWFDTDVFCVAPPSAFDPDRANVAGFERDDVVANGILKLDRAVAQAMFDAAMDVGRKQRWTFAWGDVGPRLATRILRALPEAQRHLASPDVFYPYDSGLALQALDPEQASSIAARSTHARTFHLWNEILVRHGVPTVIMPPVGSFVHQAFVRVQPDLAEVPALPVETLRRLTIPPYPTFADLVRWGVAGLRGRPIS